VAEKQRKKNDDALLLALACGATVEAASRQCDLTERTIYRRLKEPAFRDRLQALRADMVQRAAGMLTAAAAEAVRTLLSLQKQAVPATVRLGSARAILEIGMKLREVVDLEERLSRLESLMKQQQQEQPERRLSA
jgi:hypothetical protein